MKGLKIIFVLIGLIVGLVSCGQTTTYEVKFITNGGTLIEQQMVSEGESLKMPDDPLKDNYDFAGWYKNIELSESFDLEESINEDLILYAKWEAPHTKIGVVLPDSSEERWVMQDGKFFESELDKLGSGYEYEILFSDGTERKEIENVELLIELGVDVIIFAANGSGSSVAELAAEEGVILIAHDRMAKSNNEKADFYTTFNSWDVGKAQGQHLVDMATANNCSASEPCDLAVFSGRTSDWPNATYFFGGAMEVIIPAMDMFNLINVSTADLEALVQYVEDNGVITEANFNDAAKAKLQDAMATVDTDWNANTAATLAKGIITRFAGDHSSKDVYVLAPNDDTSAAIRLEFAKLEDYAYANYYTTGQDAINVAIASLMGDSINGYGIQTMTVLKSSEQLVKTSVMIAKNIIDGNEPLSGLNEGPDIDGVSTAYASLDVLTYDNPQKTYDLVFGTGLKHEEDSVFSNIDFEQYKTKYKTE